MYTRLFPCEFRRHAKRCLSPAGRTDCRGGPRAAAGLLRRQRDLPLSRPGLRRAALRPARAARRHVAQDRQRGGDLRAVAPAVAGAAPARRARAPDHRRARHRARGDERLLLHRDQRAAALDGRRDRVPRPDRARGVRHALAAQRRRPRSRRRRGCRPHRDPPRRNAARLRLRLRLRQLRALRALHRARPPHRDRGQRRKRRPLEHRPARRGNAGRDGGGAADRLSRSAAGLRRSRAARRRHRRRARLLGHSLCLRPARHGAAEPG